MAGIICFRKPRWMISDVWSGKLWCTWTKPRLFLLCAIGVLIIKCGPVVRFIRMYLIQIRLQVCFVLRYLDRVGVFWFSTHISGLKCRSLTGINSISFIHVDYRCWRSQILKQIRGLKPDCWQVLSSSSSLPAEQQDYLWRSSGRIYTGSISCCFLTWLSLATISETLSTIGTRAQVANGIHQGSCDQHHISYYGHYICLHNVLIDTESLCQS